MSFKYKKDIKCPKCKKQIMMVLQGNDLEEIEKDFEYMTNIIGDTPCSKCMSSDALVEKLLKDKETND